jgi:osmotically-inducible protein OsmY
MIVNMKNKLKVLILEDTPEVDNIISAENSNFYDTEIKASIPSSFKWYSFAPEGEISIGVQNGYISLDGVVSTECDKMIITSTAQNIRRVKGIINNLLIARK